MKILLITLLLLPGGALAMRGCEDGSDEWFAKKLSAGKDKNPDGSFQELEAHGLLQVAAYTNPDQVLVLEKRYRGQNIDLDAAWENALFSLVCADQVSHVRKLVNECGIAWGLKHVRAAVGAKDDSQCLRFFIKKGLSPQMVQTLSVARDPAHTINAALLASFQVEGENDEGIGVGQ